MIPRPPVIGRNSARDPTCAFDPLRDPDAARGAHDPERPIGALDRQAPRGATWKFRDRDETKTALLQVHVICKRICT